MCVLAQYYFQVYIFCFQIANSTILNYYPPQTIVAMSDDKFILNEASDNDNKDIDVLWWM